MRKRQVTRVQTDFRFCGGMSGDPQTSTFLVRTHRVFVVEGECVYRVALRRLKRKRSIPKYGRLLVMTVDSELGVG
jgi:hypothetical protein